MVMVLLTFFAIRRVRGHQSACSDDFKALFGGFNAFSQYALNLQNLKRAPVTTCTERERTMAEFCAARAMELLHRGLKPNIKRLDI